MKMNSKIEVRIEAVRLAVNVEGVGPENIVEVSEKISRFIIGETELPELNDPMEMLDKIKDALLLSGRTGNECNTSGDHNEETETKTGEEA